MSVKSFKFISPGIFINEIDNSQLPRIPDEIGPVVIGRTERGPAMRPVKVNSFSDYVRIFGNPIPGGNSSDTWRNGNYIAPTYAAYAAQAYLRNSSALTVVRLLGAQSSQVADGAAGEAGWETAASNTSAIGTNGGAYGLFVFPSGSATTAVTGALAAIWYLNEGAIEISGTVRGTSTVVSGSGVLVKDAKSAGDSSAGENEYKVLIKDSSGNLQKCTSFNFDRSSAKYIRKVFNTNPTLVNTDITRTANQETYWLGSTFERHLATYAATSSHAAILGLDESTNNYNAANFRFGFQAAQTPWIFSQHDQSAFSGFDATQHTKKLFKFHTLDAGEDEQKKVKISIVDIKKSTNDFDLFGSFGVEVRDARDNDNAPIVLERYSSLNLNPNSPRYIARVIGDQFIEWDDTERRHRVYGDYPNASSIVRVEVDPDVKEGLLSNPRLLPFGSYGPIRQKTWSWQSGTSEPTDRWVNGIGDIGLPYDANVTFLATGIGAGQAYDFTGSLVYPTINLRVSASDGNIPDPLDAYFGIDTTQAGSNRFEDSYLDLVRVLPNAVNGFTVVDSTEYSYIFTLDDLSSSNIAATGEVAVYVSGSRAAGNSFSARSGTYEQVLDMGYNRFTVPLQGGFDGLDIREAEPFNNTDINGGSDTTNYAFYSVRRAIDTVANPEEVEYNLLAAPGIYNSALTSHMIETCEARGDALAVIDIDSGYRAQTENTQSVQSNRGSVSTAITNLTNRRLNTSYGCAYYPWVQIRDSISDSLVFVPPSVVALGTFSSAQRNSELWFAPAGFTRGGLTEGSAGLPVIQARERLTSKNRDDLYEANINPIATFPAEGIVIFGQKTLQVTPSALDRINVRRLMIFVKKEISRIAATTLFDQNVQATWNRFTSKAEEFLRGVQARLGLTDYRIVLDDSTTTPELIDRNVLYAKIFLKPARSIEFIALDFVITNSGAGFED